MNERITEGIVRRFLRGKGYKDNEAIHVEEQKSSNQRIDGLLRQASKSGTGRGYPEFLISFDQERDLVIVIECKPHVKQHESENRDRPADFAVDGVLHYASFLNERFNVIAIAVSGSDEAHLKVSNFLWPKRQPEYRELSDVVILPWADYIHVVNSDPDVEREKTSDLIRFSKELHNYMRDYAKLSETEKPLLVSAVLIALSNKFFARSYIGHESAQRLANATIRAITQVLEDADIPDAKIKNMIQPYSFIQVHPELTNGDVLFNITETIHDKVKPFMNAYYGIDVIGQFYGEFLRYTGGDKKGLGIVLTPRHITELFAKIGRLTTDSVVLDWNYPGFVDGLQLDSDW